MKVEVPKGKFVLAVSGGVDSMVLLDLLAKRSHVELVVAHFNHNIREDSVKDKELVRKVAAMHQLAFENGSAELGKGASEEAARQARYDFLRKVQIEQGAAKIITAHHQDDVIETAFINIIRGTDRRGLSAIMNNKSVIRPLLRYPKAKILEYARHNNLGWREDTSNQDTDYLRNYLRLKVLPKMNAVQRGWLIRNLEKVAKTNNKINDEIATLSQLFGEDIDRYEFASLPIAISNELLAYRLRLTNVGDFDSKTISRLNIAIKVSKSNSTYDIKQATKLKLTVTTASFVTP